VPDLTLEHEAFICVTPAAWLALSPRLASSTLVCRLFGWWLQVPTTSL